MQNFEDFLKSARFDIERNMKVFLSKKEKETLPKVFFDLELISSLSDLVLRGKLIRGSLFLFALEMYGLKRNKELVDVACAIELLHTGLLIHDDIIDKDNIRRGLPTVHEYFAKRGEKLLAKDPYHYGASMAILVGDIAFHYAVELIGSYSGKNLGKLIEYYAKEISKVGLAEGLDSEFGQTNIEPSVNQIEEIYRYKTARYTFSMPFTMAGIIVGAPKKQIEILEEVGELIGFIFQIKDDELGLIGSEEKIGKVVGSDIRENKKTIIRQLLFEKARGKDKAILEEIFGTEDVGNEEIEKVKSLIEKYKIQKILDKQIEELVKRIRFLFGKLEVSSAYKSSLEELLTRNLKRQY